MAPLAVPVAGEVTVVVGATVVGAPAVFATSGAATMDAVESNGVDETVSATPETNTDVCGAAAIPSVDPAVGPTVSVVLAWGVGARTADALLVAVETVSRAVVSGLAVAVCPYPCFTDPSNDAATGDGDRGSVEPAVGSAYAV